MIDLSPTGSPGVDALLRTAQSILKEPELKESLEFHRHVEELQAFRRSLEKQFRESLRFYPRTELFQQLESQLDQEFERFRGGGRRLESYLASSQPEDLTLGCERVHQAILELNTLSGKLRAQEEAWRQEYGTGLGGELKFFVTQTIQGRIPYQQCAQILDRSLEASRQMEQAIGKARPENDQVSEMLDVCTVALASLIRALQRASQSLRMQHSWEIEERLSDLLEAAESLTTAHTQLMAALYPPVSCPRCGAEQPGDRPVCASCSARLPLPANSQLPPPPTPEARARFQAFAELDGKLDQWSNGKLEAAALVSWIDQFRQRLLQGKRQMQADNQLDKRLKEAILEATEASEAAMASLKRAVTENLELDEVLEQVRAAEEKMDQARQLDLDHSTPNS
ncbi:hypothetical protein ABS71_04955 [bacterium SCN 62-11]|nr:hypothetical protein [Candidatus Eremiobacteraeota bacterium]ODT75034.1 MAG: hypothetical protein ABS71_04955 [bacterium SCN 62-11]